MEEQKLVNTTILNDLVSIIETSKENAVRSVDFHRVVMYWNIGKRVFEEEQQGKEKAEYGTYLIKYLSQYLEKMYGSGFSQRQIERARKFYRTFPIASALRTQLNWTQYKMLLSIDNEDKR